MNKIIGIGLALLLLALLPAITTAAAPTITSWENDYTDDNAISFTITINTTRIVYFNVTSDQGIDNYYWSKDGRLVQSTSVENYTSEWDIGGDKVVTVYGTNANGDTQTITWNVYVEHNADESGWLNLEEMKQKRLTNMFVVFTAIGFIFLILGLLGVGCDYFMDIVSLFVSPTVFMMLGYKCYTLNTLQQFTFAGLLFIIISIIIYIYAIIRIFGLAVEEFGYGEKEWDRDPDYEYK